MSLHDILKRDVQKMISGLSKNEKCNVYPLVIHEVERIIIEIALQETENNYFRTAQILGISRSKLYRKIEKFGIDSKF
ncbi:MAG: helix-turn-helix domain-containing protein [bacterium]